MRTTQGSNRIRLINEGFLHARYDAEEYRQRLILLLTNKQSVTGDDLAWMATQIAKEGP